MTTHENEPDAVYEDFDEVFGSAIDVAVRRAIDRVGREPMGDLELGDGESVDPTDEVDETDETEPVAGPAPDPESARPSATRTNRERLEDRADERRVLGLPNRSLDGVNPYAVLGVSPSASWEQITAAYRRRARAWHPDGAEPDEAARRQELIRQLNVAYAKLRAMRERRLH